MSVSISVSGLFFFFFTSVVVLLHSVDLLSRAVLGQEFEVPGVGQQGQLVKSFPSPVKDQGSGSKLCTFPSGPYMCLTIYPLSTGQWIGIFQQPK
jgi:hypothetical protein